MCGACDSEFSNVQFVRYFLSTQNQAHHILIRGGGLGYKSEGGHLT